MSNQGTTMIVVPESIKRILERTVEVYTRDLENHRSYYDSIKVNGKTYTGSDTTRFRLKRLKDFKLSLENGSNKLLVCEKGKEDAAKIHLMYAIQNYLDPLPASDVAYIMNAVYIQDGLLSRIQKLCDAYKTQKEALPLLDFLNDAYNSSWSQDDEYYQVRDFRLVTSEKDFENILITVEDVEDITDKPFFTTIRMAITTLDYADIYEKKGIADEYRSFLEAHQKDEDFEGAIDMFNLWHDVRRTAIYYIYAPE